MVRRNQSPRTADTASNSFFASLSRLFSRFQNEASTAVVNAPVEETIAEDIPVVNEAVLNTTAGGSGSVTVAESSPSISTPSSNSVSSTAAAPSSTSVAPRYKWKARSRYATAKDALAIETPLPDGTKIVGYPTLPDPDAELKLYQVQKSGDPFEQKDLARLLPPRSIAIVACAYYPNIHQNEIPHKRNVGHAGLAVGVEREVNGGKQQGVMTINNPQGYLGGAFSGGGYGSFFIQRIKFPTGITPQEQAAYEKNIVTMTALANTYIPFAQENFNGNDPLGIHNEAKIREAGDKLILAVYGDAAARQWLRESRNTAYCAELVSAGVNTGTTTILSKAYLEGLRQRLAAQHGEDRYPNLYEKVSDRVNSKAFLVDNSNTNLQYVDLIGMVDEDIDLQPISQRCPDADQSGTGLAFKYYDFSDIAYSSIRDTYPRRNLEGLEGSELAAGQAYNAKVAKVQIAAFQQAAEKFKGLANLDAATEAAFNVYVGEVIETLDKVYNSEAERNQVMAILVQKGRQFTPTGPNGEGMFIPPDLYLMPTEGWADLENMGICFFPENLEAV